MRGEANRCEKLIEGAIRARATRRPICLLIRELFYLRPSLPLHDPVRSLSYSHYPIHLSLFRAQTKPVASLKLHSDRSILLLLRAVLHPKPCSSVSLGSLSRYYHISSFIPFSLLISTKERCTCALTRRD